MKEFVVNWTVSICACIYHHPIKSILFVPRFLWGFHNYKKTSRFESVKFIDTYPCLIDRTISTPFNAHYFYQGAWLARKLSNAKPILHVDIGSSVMMVSMLSAVVKTIFVDYRPLYVNLPEIVSVGGDITNLPFNDNSLQSLSCQHVVEHIGLGRYGDPVDPEGTVKSARELERVLDIGGILYLSLPVGRERVCFNAHRVLSPQSVQALFSNMKLIRFSYVDDAENFVDDGEMKSVENDSYACGMYIFKKIS